MIAAGLLIVLSQASFFLYGTIVLLLIGYVIVQLPTSSVTAMSAVSQVGSDLEEAARERS